MGTLNPETTKKHNMLLLTSIVLATTAQAVFIAPEPFTWEHHLEDGAKTINTIRRDDYAKVKVSVVFVSQDGTRSDRSDGIKIRHTRKSCVFSQPFNASGLHSKTRHTVYFGFNHKVDKVVTQTETTIKRSKTVHPIPRSGIFMENVNPGSRKSTFYLTGDM